MRHILPLLFLIGCGTNSTDQLDASHPPVATTSVAVIHAPAVHIETPPPPAPILIARFSPGCTDMIVKLIQSTQTRVHVLAYSFTSEPITAALIGAKRAGHEVVVVLDKSDARSPRARELKAAGVPVFIDSKHAIMHDKFVLVDNSRLETGSFNFTAAAEVRNAENCMRVDDAPGIVAQYESEYLIHRNHAVAMR